MNKAVAHIVGAAAIDAQPLGLPPGGCGTDFIDCGHDSCWLYWIFRIGHSTVSARCSELKGSVPPLAQVWQSGFIQVIIPIRVSNGEAAKAAADLYT
jgi:hypothetical protein